MSASVLMATLTCSFKSSECVCAAYNVQLRIEWIKYGIGPVNIDHFFNKEVIVCVPVESSGHHSPSFFNDFLDTEAGSTI